MSALMTINRLTLTVEQQQLLDIEHLSLQAGQSMLLCGDNASAKSLLAKVIAGDVANYQGQLTVCDKVSLLSFDVESTLLAQDRYNDDSENISGGVDWRRSVSEIINCADKVNPTVMRLAIEHLLDKPFKVLSTV